MKEVGVQLLPIDPYMRLLRRDPQDYLMSLNRRRSNIACDTHFIFQVVWTYQQLLQPLNCLDLPSTITTA